MTEALAKKKPEALVVSEGRPPYYPQYQERYGISPQSWRVLVESIWPGAKSSEAITLALSYCQARNLDPMKRPVHIVPVWSSALRREVETVWPGISELRTTATRTSNYGGCDPVQFGEPQKKSYTVTPKDGPAETFEVTFPEWAQITVYRILNGVRCPFPGPKVFWLETYASRGKSPAPNDRWKRSPYGMAEKCAEAAALRRAFPEELGNEYAAEEMEGKEIGPQSNQRATVMATTIDAKYDAIVGKTTEPTKPSEEEIAELVALATTKSINADSLDKLVEDNFPGLKLADLDVTQFNRIAAIVEGME